ncbi:flippase [Desulfurobacterium thermolithotrophum]|uniref:flippase n=1 Tax=Desulfurobacterium thermolithotrophum TaxID=64160 RepID=UPI0013D64AE7|nr:flippase [Desulfurobacterium thermolithotrophum]
MIATLKTKLQNKLANDKHFAELIKGSSIAFVLRILGIIAGYVFTLLVTRTLGAESWGIFALCLVVLQIASVVGRLGMDTALLRFTAEFTAKGEIDILKEIYKKALTLVVPFSILIAISVYFLSPVLADKVFHKPYLTNYFRIVSFIIVPFVLLWIHGESIRGLKKIKEYMLLQQSGIFTIAVILFLIGLSFLKSHFLPLISYSISIFVLATISIYLWRKYLANLSITSKTSMTSTPSTTPTSSTLSTTSFSSPTSNSSTVHRSPFTVHRSPFTVNTSPTYKSLLSVSIPMLLSSSLALIMGWTDTIMLGMFRSTQEVGVYNVALRVSMITSITLMAINTIAAPKFAEFWGKGDIKGLAKVAQQSTKLIFWTSFPILLLFLIFPKPILGIFGEEFKAGAVALMILTVGQFVSSFSGSVGYILTMTGYQKFHQNVLLIEILFKIFLSLYLVVDFGMIGIALATCISLIFTNIVEVIFIKKKLRFSTITLLNNILRY